MEANGSVVQGRCSLKYYKMRQIILTITGLKTGDTERITSFHAFTSGYRDVYTSSLSSFFLYLSSYMFSIVHGYYAGNLQIQY